MLTRRHLIGLAAAAGTLMIPQELWAQGQGNGKGGDQPGGPRKAEAKKKHQKNATAALGNDKLKKNGKHKLPKDGKLQPAAEISDGKVRAMTAAHDTKGELKGRKIKSRKKFAQGAPGVILAGLQVAQDDTWYYAYWFYDDEDDWYYWYDASWVDESEYWEEYDDWY
jgi:hypothetical protein